MVFLQVLINGLFLGGVYALISLGLTLIFGVVRVINFAHGEILMISMYASFFCFSVLGLNPYLSLIIVIPGMFLVGMLIDQVIIRPIRNAPSYMQIFATVGLSVVLINLALVFFSGDYRSINLAFAKQVVHMGDIGISLSRLIVFISAIAVAWLVWLFLDRTDMGKQIRAIAQDRDAARLMGINPNKIYMITFGIGSAMVGLAGGLIMPLYYVFPSVGAYFVLTAFVVVVLGGLGNMVGALLGGLIIGVIDSLSGYYLDPALKEMVYFLVFLGVLLFRPSGLMGMIGAEEMGMK
ncbi:MAG: branched-chain amino acid ABC transporter permease [Proteobacteria bacterium]|nr:branched-chain amino acid ABC transporter permease [Pseudomonadota bacterium]MCG2766664.1 branched-chain amino acid ABC transporter permease [Desulfarculaceae bacterium]